MDLTSRIGSELDDSPSNRALKSILEERDEALRRGRRMGLLVTVPIFAVLILHLLGTEMARGSGVRAGGILGAAFFLYRVVASRFENRPRLVLLLRRFSSYAKDEMVLARVLGRAARGLAVPVTVQDESFKGDLPMGLQAAERYLLLPVTVLLPTGILFWLPGSSSALDLIVTWLVVAVFTYLGGRAALRWFGTYRASAGDWRRGVDRIVAKIRRNSGSFSGTAVIKLPTSVWRDAVRTMLDEADAVVIDLTAMSSNLEWEIAEAFQRRPPESILLTWAATKYDADGEMPPAYLDSLEEILGPERLGRCRRSHYPREARGMSSIITEMVLPLHLARCLAASPAASERAAPGGSDVPPRDP